VKERYLLGLFPKLLIDFVDSENGSGLLDDIFRAAGIPKSRGFRENKIYPDREWQRLFSAACVRLDIAPDLMEVAFARYFARYTRENCLSIYSAFLDSKELIANLRSVHRQVIEKYSNLNRAETSLNGFRIDAAPAEGSIIAIHYSSPNKLCRFLEVLARQVTRFYGDDARVEHTAHCMKRGDFECEIHVSWEETPE